MQFRAVFSLFCSSKSNSEDISLHPVNTDSNSLLSNSNLVKESISKLKRRNNELGVSKITLILFAAFVFATVFTSFKILPFYYYHFELVNQMESLIRVASTETDKEIRERLWFQVRQMQIPSVKPEDIKIQREERIMKISLKYKEVFFITWQGKDYDIHVFDFHAYAEGQFLTIIFLSSGHGLGSGQNS